LNARNGLDNIGFVRAFEPRWKTRGRRRTLTRRLRALASFLSTLGFAVGVARTATPSHAGVASAARAVQATVDAATASGDDGSPRLSEARMPRGGGRRGAPTINPGLRDDERSLALRKNDGASLLVRHVLVPPSFVPPPPFHPPRAG
jgi:hypothetical protein